MRKALTLALFILFAASMFAQKPTDLLATSTGRQYKLADLSPELQKDLENVPAAISQTRTAVLEQMINQRVLSVEAKARGLSVGALLAAERAKVAAPADDEITKVIEGNRETLAGLSPEVARERVIAYLRSEPEQKALGEYVNQLRAKHKVVAGKDINARLLAPAAVVATVAGQPILAREFEENARFPLYELRAEVAEAILDELNQKLFDTLVAEEAKSLSIDAGTLIAREITNKMKDFTDQERFTLEEALIDKLYKKYKVNILHKEPVAPIEKVTADDDPFVGPATAPVTIIMFSDFQCSACAATHPILKEAITAYPGKVRFVIRDYPLESIHENGFNAAMAAGAANAQGKFFEYIEILYKNQEALDAASLVKYAEQIGLNVAKFELDFKSERIAAEIRKDMADGDALGINSTPTIFVNGRRVRRNSPYAFRAAIEAALKK